MLLLGETIPALQHPRSIGGVLTAIPPGLQVAWLPVKK